VLFPSAAFFAAHLAFIAAASCARRSGERFNLLLAFLALLGFFASVVGSQDFFPADAVARAADLLAAFDAFADSACCSLRFRPVFVFARWGGSKKNRVAMSESMNDSYFGRVVR
jgi:hypothetical protein